MIAILQQHERIVSQARAVVADPDQRRDHPTLHTLAQAVLNSHQQNLAEISRRQTSGNGGVSND